MRPPSAKLETRPAVRLAFHQRSRKFAEKRESIILFFYGIPNVIQPGMEGILRIC
jgi:hypothetical protein